MIVYSYISKNTKGSDNLRLSLEKFGYSYKFIGIGEVWKGFIKSKIVGLYNSLLSETEEIICIVDGYDMLANDYPDRLLQKYKEFQCNIVFGGEKFCFGYNGTPIYKYSHIPFRSARKYLNGGFCIGKRNAILNLYKFLQDTGTFTGINDDQKLVCEYVNTRDSLIEVDMYQKLCFNTVTGWDKKFKKDQSLYIPSYNSIPSFIHFPSNMSDGCERYNLYGKAILGKKFNYIYGKSSNQLFSNKRAYICFFLSFIIFLIYKYRHKGILILNMILNIIFTYYIRL